MRIGIFGGSFNPVHEGHLALARSARSKLGLKTVVFVPSHRTPLKKDRPLMPAALRARWLKKALKTEKSFVVSDHEIRKKGVSYTVDTLRYFKKKYKKGSELYFLAGADTAASFFRWKSPDEVLKLCRFAVMTRPGHPLRARIPNVLLLPMKAVDISSTTIRRRLKAGQSVKGMVPSEIEKDLEKYFKKKIA